MAGDLYVGGHFTTACGTSSNRVAKWDGSTWSTLGSGLGTGGTIVTAMAVSGSDLYVGGIFSSAGGLSANNVAKWDGSAWSALGAGAGASGDFSMVHALAVSGSDLYMGGSFSMAGGSSANGVAKWDGSAWSALGSGVENVVRALAVSGDDLYVGGGFTTAGGKASAYVARAIGAAAGPTLTTQPVVQQIFTGSNATFTVSATTTNPPIRYQWCFNGADLPGETNESLTIANAQVPNVGNYQVVVTDSKSYTPSAVVKLDLIDALFITTQPADVATRAGSNATFTVSVYGTAPFHAQWRFNDTDLPDATNLVLAVSNVQAAQLGDYTVVVTNTYGAITSAVATLTFLTPPTIVEPPQPVTVEVGGDATFTVTVTNTATLPITYQWRKASTVITNITLNSRTCSFTMFNVQTNVTDTSGPGNYRVVVQNFANSSPGLASPLVALTVVPAVPRPTISSYTRLGSGDFQLRFNAAAGTDYTILVSTNLIDWTSLGAPTETAPGQFEFTDTDAPDHPTRFYQLRRD